jgi:hypothetical protein
LDKSKQQSAMILERLRFEAAKMARRDVRLATVERLVKACDGIEGGELAANLPISASRREARLKLDAAINPTNVERYIKLRRKADKSWTGPTRITVQSDEGLLSYVVAREAERLKPILPVRPTDQAKRIAAAIVTAPSLDDQILLRQAIEEGKRGVRQRDIMYHYLRTQRGVNVERLLTGDNLEQSVVSNGLNDDDRQLLRGLLHRFQDADLLARFRLKNEDCRVKQVGLTEATLIKKTEMALLQRLAS